MSTNESSFDKDTGPADTPPPAHESVRITGDYAYLETLPTDEQELARHRYARILRHITEDALKAMGVDEVAQERARAVAAELLANGSQHGGVHEIIVTRRRDIGPMAVKITVVNPIDGSGTPGVEGAGRHVAEVGNDVAEHGRGLGGIVEGLTRGSWGQENKESDDGSSGRRLHTFAVVDNAPLEDHRPTPFDHAA